MKRDKLIEHLEDRIVAIEKDTPVLVGVDGADASGKTTLAEELAHGLKKTGRHVIRVSIDGFHNPKRIRYLKGQDSPEGYYSDSFNYQELIDKLLSPLSDKDNLFYETKTFDFLKDSEVNSSTKRAETNSILIMEGVFLFRSQLVNYWDFKIFIDVDFKSTLNRAVKRGRISMTSQTRRIIGLQLLGYTSKHGGNCPSRGGMAYRAVTVDGNPGDLTEEAALVGSDELGGFIFGSRPGSPVAGDCLVVDLTRADPDNACDIADALSHTDVTLMATSRFRIDGGIQSSSSSAAHAMAKNAVLNKETVWPIGLRELTLLQALKDVLLAQEAAERMVEEFEDEDEDDTGLGGGIPSLILGGGMPAASRAVMKQKLGWPVELMNEMDFPGRVRPERRPPRDINREAGQHMERAHANAVEQLRGHDVVVALQKALGPNLEDAQCLLTLIGAIGDPRLFENFAQACKMAGIDDPECMPTNSRGKMLRAWVQDFATRILRGGVSDWNAHYLAIRHRIATDNPAFAGLSNSITLVTMPEFMRDLLQAAFTAWTSVQSNEFRGIAEGQPGYDRGVGTYIPLPSEVAAAEAESLSQSVIPDAETAGETVLPDQETVDASNRQRDESLGESNDTGTDGGTDPVDESIQAIADEPVAEDDETEAADAETDPDHDVGDLEDTFEPVGATVAETSEETSDETSDEKVLVTA